MPCEDPACKGSEQFKVTVQCLGCMGRIVLFLCPAHMEDPGPLLSLKCNHGPKRATASPS